MDGFAVRSLDLAPAAAGSPTELAVREVIAAGRVASRPLEAGEAFRIMTGAPLPPGADAIVPFEDCETLGEARARFARPARPGDHVRRAGHDLAAGALALAAGRDLSAHDVALLAALGRADVEVGRRPRVAILSTGDELLDVEAPLTPGAIRDSNVPMLAALVEEAGGLVTRRERVRDDPADVIARCRLALAHADVVLTIGGVSAGDYDPVKLAIDAIGDIELWRVAMKPGRPQAFGTPQGRLFFGLPGNPASVACVFEALVRPALRRMQGFAAIDRPRFPVHAAERIESRAGRTDFVRARIERRGEGWWASPAGDQVSGHLTPQAWAHALVVVPAEVDALEAGAWAEAWRLRDPE